jgi:hypothetical protein
MYIAASSVPEGRMRQPLFCKLGWVGISLALFACSKGADDVHSHHGNIAPSVDVSTPEERRIIDQNLSEIENLAAELGKPQRFRSIPIKVTEESMLEANRAGYCVIVNGSGSEINVNRRVLDEEKKMAAEGVEVTLFRVLLHEIGHCYLGRGHFNAKIEYRGRHFQWNRKDEGKRPVHFPFLNVSSMEERTLIMPVALKRYYVAEILGLARATSVFDLRDYADISVVDLDPDPMLR